jgi:hypothetical protein
MSFERRKRKSWSEMNGVSDVVGNILILLITVVLFTSIIMFVNKIPVPQQATKVDFVASISFFDGGTRANLTVTHAGGALLQSTQTLILVQRDNTNFAYYLNNDTDWNRPTWSTGVSWKKLITGMSYTTRVTVTVIDLDKSSTIWTSQVTGGSGGNPPGILQRYIDSNTLTQSADPVKESDNFTMYVYVSDVDGDLDTTKVWINSSMFQGAIGLQRSPKAPISAGPMGGWFEWYFLVWDMTSQPKQILYHAEDLDGAVVIIHATDKAGHETVSTFTIDITILPTDVLAPYEPNFIYGNYPGEGGLPAYLTWSSPATRSGFGIYEENRSNPGTANVSMPKTAFVKDEAVFIRVASLYISNVLGENRVILTDTRTGTVYTPTYNGTSSSSVPFYPYLSGGGAYVYECVFYTGWDPPKSYTSLPPGSYTVDIYLASAGAPGSGVQRFQTRQHIIITQGDSPIDFIPTIWLFKDAARTIIWGNKTTPYDISGGTFKVYASVRVMDTTATAPTAEEVRIMDMSGGSELYGKPPAGSMISGFSQGNSTAYKFEIDLRYNNGNQWLSSTNAYTVFTSKFSDANEGVYSLSQQIYVKGFGSRADFFVGSDGLNVGHSNFDVKSYLSFIENNNFFTQTTMFEYTNTPSDKTTYTTVALGVGDISGDGDKDLLMGQDTTATLLYFKNSMNSYGRWQDGSMMARYTSDAANNIRWIAVGDINGDGVKDFMTVSTANKIVLYNNTYGMSPYLYKDYAATVVRKIALMDMTGDSKAELIILAGGKIYVHDLSKWGTANPVQIAKIPDPDSASGIVDFSIADVNKDGMYDILTTGTGGAAGVNGVWINYYKQNPVPTVTKLDSTVVGFSPYILYGHVESGGIPSTQTLDGVTWLLSENDTIDPKGRVDVRAKFVGTLSSDPHQVLSVYARLAPTSTEPYYVWYSTDAGGLGMYTFAFAIHLTSWHNYTFPLPTNVVNRPLYLRITDSSTVLGLSLDQLDIDFIGVYSNIFGGYVTTRTQVTTTATYTCVRAGNIDGVGWLEVVAARDGFWQVYQNTTALAGWSGTDVNFYVRSGNALLTNTAPTLFSVVDVNGDGYSDILVCNKTTVQNTVSQFGFWMNLYPTKVFFRVAELGRTGGSGALTFALAVDLYSGS